MPAGKALVFVIVPVVLVGGVVGAGLAGVVNIPGLTPQPSKGKAGMYGEAAAMYGEGKDPVPVAKAAPAAPPPAERRPRPTPAPTTRIDAEAGAKRLARIWNNLDTAALAAISADYTERDLALLLSKMEAEKVAQLLATVEPARAAALSREMQRLASVVPVEPERP